MKRNLAVPYAFRAVSLKFYDSTENYVPFVGLFQKSFTGKVVLFISVINQKPVNFIITFFDRHILRV